MYTTILVERLSRLCSDALTVLSLYWTGEIKVGKDLRENIARAGAFKLMCGMHRGNSYHSIVVRMLGISLKTIPAKFAKAYPQAVFRSVSTSNYLDFMNGAFLFF